MEQFNEYHYAMRKGQRQKNRRRRNNFIGQGICFQLAGAFSTFECNTQWGAKYCIIKK